MTSQIQVNFIQSYDPANSAVTFPEGIYVPSGKSINSSSGMVISGILTATSFVGDGSALTGVSFATASKSIAFSLIAG